MNTAQSTTQTRPDPPNHSHRAAALGNHDGDTVTLLVELDFGARAEVAVRVLGVNTPELATPEGKVAQRWVAAWLADAGPGRWPLTIASWQPLVPITPDKFGGRWDARVWRDSDNAELGAALIAAGLGVAWDGKGVKPVPVPVPTPGGGAR